MRVEITITSTGRKFTSDVRNGVATFGTLAAYVVNLDGSVALDGPKGIEAPSGTWRALPGADFSHSTCHKMPCAICRDYLRREA
jgi:hypothetical protein